MLLRGGFEGSELLQLGRDITSESVDVELTADLSDIRQDQLLLGESAKAASFIDSRLRNLAGKFRRRLHLPQTGLRAVVESTIMQECSFLGPRL